MKGEPLLEYAAIPAMTSMRTPIIGRKSETVRLFRKEERVPRGPPEITVHEGVTVHESPLGESEHETDDGVESGGATLRKKPRSLLLLSLCVVVGGVDGDVLGSDESHEGVRVRRDHIEQSIGHPDPRHRREVPVPGDPVHDPEAVVCEDPFQVSNRVRVLEPLAARVAELSHARRVVGFPSPASDPLEVVPGRAPPGERCELSIERGGDVEMHLSGPVERRMAREQDLV